MPSYLCVQSHLSLHSIHPILSTFCLRALPATRAACQLPFLLPPIVTALPVPCSEVAASQFGAEGSTASLQVVETFQICTCSSSTSRFPPLEPSLFHSSYGTRDHTLHISLPISRFRYTHYTKLAQCSHLPLQDQEFAPRNQAPNCR